MNYLLVDDEEIILKGMEWTLKEVIGDEPGEIVLAGDPYEALDQLRKHKIDIVFCDVDMPGMNGLRLAEEMKKISPDTQLIFATGYAHYSLDAWNTIAKAFILKPVGAEDIRKALDKVTLSKEKEEAVKKAAVADDRRQKAGGKDITVMCFGNFDLMYNGQHVHFSRKKSKEMLAYLIDRKGAMVSTDEIRAILWEEEDDSEEKKGYVRVLANDIRRSFESLGITDVIINNQNSYAIDKSRIACDYYDMLDNVPGARDKFAGEYMNQFSWAEMTLGHLLEL